MKGYITNNKCYIFPQEAGQIPEVEASVFYVQQEDYVAWIEENESLADKISPYNYNVMTVNPKVWANHENDDLEPVGPTYVTLTCAADYSAIFVDIPESIPVNDYTQLFAQSGVDLNDYTATVKDANDNDVNHSYGEGYLTIQPTTDSTITLTMTPVVTTYTLTLSGDNILEYTDVKINNEYVTNTGEWEVNENDNIKIEYKSSTGTYNIIQEPNDATPILDGNGGTEFNMPAEDTEVIIDFVDGSSSSGAGES